MRQISRVIFLFILLPIHLLSCGQTNKYYISSVNGFADGDGSIDRPWNSLNFVNTLDLAPGDTVFFERGSSWSGSFEIHASGLQDSPIVYTAYGSGDLPAISNPDAEIDNGNAIRISASHIVVENLYVHDCGVSDARTVAGIASFDTEDHHITIQNCKF